MLTLLQENLIPPLISYLCGTFPTAFLMGKIFYHKDIYSLGSGNGGATNSYRALGKKAGLIVFIIDFSKGFLPLLIASKRGLPEKIQLVMVLTLLLGHAYPPWTGFKGGKGIAVTAASVSVILPGVIPFCGIVFIGTALLSGYISLASLAASLTMPLYFLLRHVLSPQEDFLTKEIFLFLYFLLTLFFHRSNIHRLVRGKERSWKKAKQDKEASFQEDGD
jgi:acyl phosphate:glycerol-3-phosphate acyltransferase